MAQRVQWWSTHMQRIGMAFGLAWLAWILWRCTLSEPAPSSTILFSTISSCGDFIKAIDRSEKGTVLSAYDYAYQILVEEDQKHILKKERSLLAPMSSDGIESLIISSWQICRMHPTLTVKQSVLEAYVSTRAIGVALGFGK